MATPKLNIIALPNSLGAEWFGESGTRLSLSVLRPSNGRVYFGMQAQPGREWSTTYVENPERFGPIPTDINAMRAYAVAFLDAGAE